MSIPPQGSQPEAKPAITTLPTLPAPDPNLGVAADGTPIKVGVLTSGGDAQGMNAAVRSVVRTALYVGAQPYAIMEGWQGAVDGGSGIKPMSWEDVGSILQRGGTVIGTARSADFREWWGMKQAAKNLLEHGIDHLVVIGGDGSLSGTNQFRQEWPSLLAELEQEGQISGELAQRHPHLFICGLVGSIDNDVVGTATTIGADSALHRIVEAIDALSSTAASHQRSFVIEVMGRHCGYLPLMAAIAGGCDYVFVPEQPPGPDWPDAMCQALRRGREAGRRDSLVIVAEGACDHEGNPIKASDVSAVISQQLHEDARVTILGHVQRGGTPSAFDRWMSTVLGYRAVIEVLTCDSQDEAVIIGVKGNRVTPLPLVESVARTREVATLLDSRNFEAAIQARGEAFGHMLRMYQHLANAPQPSPPSLLPPQPEPEVDVKKTVKKASAATTTPSRPRRIALMHVGGLAPGMNPAVRAAVRLGVQDGHTMLGVCGSFAGLAQGQVRELSWADVDAWINLGGAELGTRRDVPAVEDLYRLGRALEEHQIDALMVIGGFTAYLSAHMLVSERERYPAFRIPIVCVPASIDNNLPGAELSLGADTALNDAVSALDRIKLAASASRRCFVAETMGRRCGYLTLMAGIATGAEQVYLHEDEFSLRDLEQDVARMQTAFQGGRRLFMALRSEGANDLYTTDFLAHLFAAEAHGLYDVRQAILGHIQQGGTPSPFDRIHATRLASFALDQLSAQLKAGTSDGLYVGQVQGVLRAQPLTHMLEEVDLPNTRPRYQWWQEIGVVQRTVSAAVPVPTPDIQPVEAFSPAGTAL